MAASQKIALSDEEITLLKEGDAHTFPEVGTPDNEFRYYFLHFNIAGATILIERLWKSRNKLS